MTEQEILIRLFHIDRELETLADDRTPSAHAKSRWLTREQEDLLMRLRAGAAGRYAARTFDTEFSESGGECELHESLVRCCE